MHNTSSNNQQSNSSNMDANNLKVLEDQLSYESLMNRKFSTFAQSCNDAELKNLCQQAAQKHKQHFDELYNYLSSHQ